MLVLIIFTALMSIRHSICSDSDICTENDLCLPVDEKVCDIGECKKVKYSDIHEIISKGANITTWNILRTVLAGPCPIGLKFDPTPRCARANEVIGTFTHHFGESCNHSISIERTFHSNIEDTESMHVLSSEVGDLIYEDCILYIKPGNYFVMRRCENEDCGHGPRASFFIIETIQQDYDRSAIPDILKYYNVGVTNQTVDCFI